MCEGDKKLVRDGTNPDQFFDLKTDVGETKDLASEDAKTAVQLGDALDVWLKQMSKHLAFLGDSGPEREWPDRNAGGGSPPTPKR